MNFFKKSPFLCGVFFLFLSACTKNINPYDYSVQPPDREISENPPDESDLAYSQQAILFLISSESLNLLRSQEQEILRSFGNSLENIAGLQEFTPKNADPAQSNPVAPDKLNVYLQTAFSQNFDYIGFLEIKVLNSRISGDRNLFQAEIINTIYHAPSGNEKVSKKLLYDSSKPSQNQKIITKFFRTYFPLKSFILELRGNKTVARISAGRTSGLVKGEKFLIRKRIVKGNLGSRQDSLNFTKKISYSEPIGEGEVVLVLEDEAWIYFKNKLEKAKIGDLAFRKS